MGQAEAEEGQRFIPSVPSRPLAPPSTRLGRRGRLLAGRGAAPNSNCYSIRKDGQLESVHLVASSPLLLTYTQVSMSSSE
jgi:hypothetical protein